MDTLCHVRSSAYVRDSVESKPIWKESMDMNLQLSAIPTIANCDAPMNITTESTTVWKRLRPAAVEMAPNESALTPMPSASRTMARLASADCHSVRADGVPRGPEVVHSLPGRIAGLVVRDHVVQRVARIRDLLGAVLA